MSQKSYPGFKWSQIYWHIFERVLQLYYACLDSDIGLLWQLKFNSNQQQTVFTLSTGLVTVCTLTSMEVQPAIPVQDVMQVCADTVSPYLSISHFN